MIKIWGRPNSINVQKVMWTLGELELPHVRVDVGGEFGGLDSDAYGAKNPNRLIPVLDEDGRTLWESQTIVRYLCTKHASGSLCPHDAFQRAIADQWMEWKVTTILADLTPLFWGLVRGHPDQQDLEKRAALAAHLGETFKILDAQLDGKAFVLGDGFTMADIPVGAATWRYMNLEIERPALGNLERWFQSLKQRPAYQTHVMIPLT